MSKRIRKAVLPVAGLGTRFLPATKAVPKEMLTVVDRPVVQHVVDEAREAGIEHFVFVTGRGKAVIEDHFDMSYELEDTLRRRNKTKEYDALMADLPKAGATSFTRQQAPLGLGHAVWCARDIIGDEPFAVLLPDMITLPNGPRKSRCLAQAMEAYGKHGGNIIAVEEVSPSETHHYGIVSVGADYGHSFEIKGMVEKPPQGTAPSNWMISGRYILEPRDFRVAGEGRKRRGRRNPAHRRHDQARGHAAVPRRAVRRQDLRHGVETGIFGRQYRLWAGAPGHSGRAAGGDQAAAGVRGARLLLPLAGEGGPAKGRPCEARHL